jgi:hypothetical protein
MIVGEVAHRGSVRVERLVSDLIGGAPKSGPKKHGGAVRLRCGRVLGCAAKGRFGIGAFCPRVSVVMGDVSDIGESYRRAVPLVSISRLRE